MTSLITSALIFMTSAIAIAALSWIYADLPPAKRLPDSKIEIKWGEGS
jgi:hypothetical protein